MAQPEVNTRSGRLRGLKQKSIEGFDFYAFKGIPYAKPPVGELRFKDPITAEPWTGIRNALEFGPISAQFDFVSKITDGSDDCLYLNVYSKSIESSSRNPVMFFIHGGGFMCGSGNDLYYGPDYLMRKDIVLVTLNYRLGVLGFLNLEDEIASGNQGLKDQVMALQWVRDNIANFGGDPENVTIFGESAGGSSVHYLTISPLAKGLFHKAISQSGVALNPFAAVPGDPKKYAYQLCSLLGTETTDPTKIVNLLRTVEASKLIELQGKLGMKELLNSGLCPFGPGVDDKSPRPYMPISRELAAEQAAHVPYLLGYTDREGMFMFKLLASDNYESRDANFEDFIHPQTLEMFKRKKLTANDLRQMYFKSEKITNENSENWFDLVGDTFFVEGIHKVAKVQAERNSAPTYLYRFVYGQGPTFPKFMFNSQTSEASHMDDLIYLFSMKFFETFKVEPLKKGTIDYRIMEQMVELWTNFAKTGRPTPTITELLPVHWLPVNDGTVLRYLNIGEELRMEKVLNIEERYSYKINEYQNIN